MIKGRSNKVTVVNRALPSLHGGLLEITLSVPLTTLIVLRKDRVLG